MKKSFFYLFVSIILLFAFVCPIFAAVGIYESGTPQGTATDLEFPSLIGDQLTNDGSKFTFNLLHSGIGTSGGTTMTTADTTVPVAYGYVAKAIEPTDTLFQTGTLPDGIPGKMLTIHITECSAGKWEMSITTSSQISMIRFDAVNEVVTLLWIDSTYGWTLAGYTNATFFGIQ